MLGCFSKVPTWCKICQWENLCSLGTLFSALVIFCMGSPILGWQERNNHFSFLHFARIQLCCLCFTPLLCSENTNIDQMGFLMFPPFSPTPPLMPRCSARYFFILHSSFSLLLLLGHAFNASEAMIALRFSVWFIFFFH